MRFYDFSGPVLIALPFETAVSLMDEHQTLSMAETGIASTQVESQTDFDYPVRRVEGQAKWHSAKATWNKRRYYTFEIATLVAGALIPIVNVWAGEDSTAVRVWSAILGGVVVLAAGISKLFKFQENWLQYRGIAEALTRERELFFARAAEYAGDDETARRALLVERAETLLANVTAQFIATHRSQPKADGSTSGQGS